MEVGTTSRFAALMLLASLICGAALVEHFEAMTPSPILAAGQTPVRTIQSSRANLAE
jgi:hypothetical protein